jgi:hypothetical protein
MNTIKAMRIGWCKRNKTRALFNIVLLGLAGLLLAGCRDEFERMPKASETELQTLISRYQAFVEDAKKTKPEDAFQLLHHFTGAALSVVKSDDFMSKAAKFIAEASSGNMDKIKIRGATKPPPSGRLRLLLITIPSGKGAIPFCQSADGWKLDDVDIAFGDFDKKFNPNGTVPAFPPSLLSALSALQDPQSDTKEKVKAALRLLGADDKTIASQFVAKETNPWAKAALLYVIWKNGGQCEPFAKAFPIEESAQKQLYDADIDSFHTMLEGLCECASVSRDAEPTLKVYQGCYLGGAGPRSVYAELLIPLANKRPEMILKASLQSGYKYEEDPVANIMVGGLHGEQQSGFYKYITTHAKQPSKTGRLAKEWLAKMAEKDQEEVEGGATSQ